MRAVSGTPVDSFFCDKGSKLFSGKGKGGRLQQQGPPTHNTSLEQVKNYIKVDDSETLEFPSPISCNFTHLCFKAGGETLRIPLFGE